MPLPIDEVEEVDPTDFLKVPQKYESLEEATALASDADAAIKAKASAGDIMGALKIASAFIKPFLPIPFVVLAMLLTGCLSAHDRATMDEQKQHANADAAYDAVVKGCKNGQCKAGDLPDHCQPGWNK